MCVRAFSIVFNSSFVKFDFTRVSIYIALKAISVNLDVLYSYRKVLEVIDSSNSLISLEATANK